ncbi:MAG: hypothetical protein IJI78_07220 [Oscillospiraceae bacterium]|nr:hypothetical protein [Oscillospiraceae bacterium]
MKKKGKLLILVFMAMLILPVLAYPVLAQFIDTENHENRVLAEFPSVSDGADYFSKLTVWFNDNLPYKNQLVSLHSSLFMSLFNTTPNPRVVVGEDGWLFYNNYDAENPVDDILGRTSFSADEAAVIENNLKEAGTSLKEDGITFVFLLAPNKESIYREQLPGYLRDIAAEQTRADILAGSIDTGDCILVYPKDEILKEKENRQLYYRYDTHWNRLGAYVGFRSICHELGIDVPPLTEMSVADDMGYPRDLADLAGIGGRCSNDTEYVITDLCSDVKVTETQENGVTVYTSDAKTDKTVLVIHDSYYRSMQGYFPRVFSKVISVDRNYSDLYSVQQYIGIYHPDIVIMEVVERGIQIMLHENMPF